jgi:hypothetical protein
VPALAGAGVRLFVRARDEHPPGCKCRLSDGVPRSRGSSRCEKEIKKRRGAVRIDSARRKEGRKREGRKAEREKEAGAPELSEAGRVSTVPEAEARAHSWLLLSGKVSDPGGSGRRVIERVSGSPRVPPRNSGPGRRFSAPSGAPVTAGSRGWGVKAFSLRRGRGAGWPTGFPSRPRLPRGCAPFRISDFQGNGRSSPPLIPPHHPNAVPRGGRSPTNGRRTGPTCRCYLRISLSPLSIFCR